MKEFAVMLRAHQFVKSAGIASIPVDINKYATAANSRIKISNELDNDELGNTFQIGGKNTIVVNGNHIEVRQRFTILHEIAHIVLRLPSNHHDRYNSESNLISYTKRPPEEMLCDVFAAECLLPQIFFRNDVSRIDVSMDSIKDLAEKYKASITSTGSRFAVYCDIPCAFILIERGIVRYVSRSNRLRELGGWISIGTSVPKGSVAHQLLNTNIETQKYDELPTYVWFNNGVGNYRLLEEESITLQQWGQCLSLIWFDDDLEDVDESSIQHSDEEPLLEELDGILPWRSKK